MPAMALDRPWQHVRRHRLLYQQARKAGIKPIVGIEAYMSPRRSRLDRDRTRGHSNQPSGAAGQATWTGYRQPDLKLTTRARTSRVSTTSPASIEQFLREHSEGLIGLSACLKGEVNEQHPRQRRMKTRLEVDRDASNQSTSSRRRQLLSWSLQDHGLAGAARRPTKCCVGSRVNETAIPLVATNDCHYSASTRDSFAHDVTALHRHAESWSKTIRSACKLRVAISST